MNQETRQCQNCHQPFTIEPDDFVFYEKIQVPAPTFCPDCRTVRRMTFRNERTIYKRKCDLCGIEKVSVYAPFSPLIVYCYECFYKDTWDQFASGREYNFSKSFFEQYAELAKRAPKLGLQKSNDLVNTEYGNHVGGDKNCYLLFASVNNEDCMYCTYVSYSKGVVDALRVFKSESCFNSVDCEQCNNLKYSQQCQNSFDGYFLYNCRSCSNCFMCSNLIGKSYCVRNRQVTKEEYHETLKKERLGSRTSVDALREEFVQLREQSLQRAVEGVNHAGSSGNNLRNTKNCKLCFDLSQGEDCSYVIYGNDVKDTMDAYASYPKTELCYETVGAGAPAYNAKFSYLPWTGSDLTYCINAFSGCHNCFGCNQIHNAQYCILNKQYTKEGYEALVPKIIEQMKHMPYVDSKGREYRYGEYFPSELSPFAYNETIVQEYFPLTKEQALGRGYRWHDPDMKEYKITKKPEDLPDDIANVTDAILQEVIGCLHHGTCAHQCATAFKITSDELGFYRRTGSPLPQLCPNCRHYERLKQRNPLKLWHRMCQCAGAASENGVYQNTGTHQHGAGKCSNEFETSYSPDRKEIVYCEQCYNAEVV
jgi:hypothetical protein